MLSEAGLKGTCTAAGILLTYIILLNFTFTSTENKYFILLPTPMHGFYFDFPSATAKRLGIGSSPSRSLDGEAGCTG